MSETTYPAPTTTREVMCLPINGYRENGVTVTALENRAGEVLAWTVRNDLGYEQTFPEKQRETAFSKAFEMAAWSMKVVARRY